MNVFIAIICLILSQLAFSEQLIVDPTLSTGDTDEFEREYLYPGIYFQTLLESEKTSSQKRLKLVTNANCLRRFLKSEMGEENQKILNLLSQNKIKVVTKVSKSFKKVKVKLSDKVEIHLPDIKGEWCNKRSQKSIGLSLQEQLNKKILNVVSSKAFEIFNNINKETTHCPGEDSDSWILKYYDKLKDLKNLLKGYKYNELKNIAYYPNGKIVRLSSIKKILLKYFYILREYEKTKDHLKGGEFELVVNIRAISGKHEITTWRYYRTETGEKKVKVIGKPSSRISKEEIQRQKHLSILDQTGITREQCEALSESAMLILLYTIEDKDYFKCETDETMSGKSKIVLFNGEYILIRADQKVTTINGVDIFLEKEQFVLNEGQENAKVVTLESGQRIEQNDKDEDIVLNATEHYVEGQVIQSKITQSEVESLSDRLGSIDVSDCDIIISSYCTQKSEDEVYASVERLISEGKLSRDEYERYADFKKRKHQIMFSDDEESIDDIDESDDFQDDLDNEENDYQEDEE